MSNSLNLNEVIEHVKNIVDGIRCYACDKTEGGRVRFSCGHSTCDDCLTVSEECLRCLTPPDSLSKKPVLDEPLSQRAKNARLLLNVCQDTFNLDVYRRLRVSEQLKAEKELFPECIQAPVKYYNKRKSLPSQRNKENLSLLFYPGEAVSPSNSLIMNKRENYIQQWLTSSESFSRKALSDLNVNGQSIKGSTSKGATKNHKIKNHSAKQRKTFSIGKKNKKNHTKLSSSIDSCYRLGLNSKKSKNKMFDIFQSDVEKKITGKNENDESGIVLDDEPILIEDSQSQLVDKDALALQAVLAADNEQLFCDKSTVSLEKTQTADLLPLEKTDIITEHTGKISKKVAFYKKDCLAKSCSYCNESGDTEIKSDSKNISITIENTSFTTTINISSLTENGHTNNSTHVQTDISDIMNISDTHVGKNVMEENLQNTEAKDMQSQDLLPNVLESKSNIDEKSQKQTNMKRGVQSPNIFNLYNDVPSKKRCIVIDDSDSDVSSVEVSLLHVSAEVHRSCDAMDYGILGEIDANLPNRSKNKARGATPDSNNSSDKENCDPNKRKNQKKLKKSKCSKK